ncbi:MAG: D-alanyl-D-alanine carboxypeptidase [Oscillospiraceae bacterium]|jgi:D-alanyl-D-alanine carboxypeptidase (penicillin-binding protein 5/6)|nr:D-alanyl-D-alanine carboxypeptidase [Oscillospiraceae bacterium]
MRSNSNMKSAVMKSAVMKSAVSLVACALFFSGALLYNKDARAESEPYSSAKSAYVMEASTGRTLFSWNAREQLPMASTTKVMTALIALERGGLDEIVTCSRNAFGVGGTSIYLQLGEQLTMADMLLGLMLASGNDAAVAIAEHVGGDLPTFYEMMNTRALQLGAYDSNFASPNGLPTDGHYTTAYDLALITQAAMRIPKFREIVSTQRAAIPWANHEYDRVLVNKNRLLSDYSGATGVKTGFTRAAGRCLVFGAERDGMEIIGVVLNCSDWFDEAERLMNLAFDGYSMVGMLSDGDIIRSLPVVDGLEQSVRLRLDGDLAAPFSKNESVRVELDLPDVVNAPTWPGEVIGFAKLYANDALVAERPIVADSTIERRSFVGALRQIIRNWLLI